LKTFYVKLGIVFGRYEIDIRKYMRFKNQITFLGSANMYF